MEMDLGVSVNRSPNLSTNNQPDLVSMPICSKGSPVNADNPAANSSGSNQSSVMSSVTDSQDFSVSVGATLSSAEGNETNINVSDPFSADDSAFIVDNPTVKSILDSDESPIVKLPVTNSQDIGVSVDDKLNSAMSNEGEKVAVPSFCQESSVTTDNPAENNLDFDQSSTVLSVTGIQDIGVSTDETLNSDTCNERDKVSVPCSSEESPANSDNPIVEENFGSDQSSTEAVTTSQDIGVSVTTSLDSSIRNEMEKVSVPSSFKENPIDSDNPTTERSLNSDQSSTELPVTNSQVIIGDSVNTTLDSSMINETDKVSIPSADNSISKNCSDQSSMAPPAKCFQDIVSEENFYDLQAWPASDSDEEFFSVRGDFSNASSRQGSMKGSPLEEISDCKLEPLPTEEKEMIKPLSGNLTEDHCRISPTIKETGVGESEHEHSPIDETKKLADLLQDPFWRGQAKDQNSVQSNFKETKLVEFFQDSHGSPPTASTHASAFPSSKRNDGVSNSELAISHSSQRNGTSTKPREYSRTLNSRTQYVPGKLKQENARAIRCCFPSWSQSRGSKDRKRQTPA